MRRGNNHVVGEVAKLELGVRWRWGSLMFMFFVPFLHMLCACSNFLSSLFTAGKASAPRASATLLELSSFFIILGTVVTLLLLLESGGSVRSFDRAKLLSLVGAACKLLALGVSSSCKGRRLFPGGGDHDADFIEFEGGDICSLTNHGYKSVHGRG